MHELLEKKTGILRLKNGVELPCDATINTDNTFDTLMVATIGETMYYTSPTWNFKGNNAGPILMDKSRIKKVKIIGIDYATNCALCLKGITIEGEKVGGVQECFFSTYEGAEKAVEAVNSFFEENDPNPEWMKDYLKCVTPEYRYMLKFPLKPGDILLEDEEHYVANRIVAKIGPDSSKVNYQGHDDISYISGREVHTEHQYSGIKDQYQIVSLVAEEQIIIDV